MLVAGFEVPQWTTLSLRAPASLLIPTAFSSPSCDCSCIATLDAFSPTSGANEYEVASMPLLVRLLPPPLRLLLRFPRPS